MRKYFIIVVFISLFHFTYSKNIEGVIRDDSTGDLLEGVTVVLGDSAAITVTNLSGTYKFSDVEPGRHKITALHPEYVDAVIFDVWIRNGKISTQDIVMIPQSKGRAALAIFKSQALSEIGHMIISEEQLNRFAGTYHDPARLVTIAPDLTIADDRSNRVSARGISPNYNTWRLEDVEIVNPNHLANAGTFSDYPTPTGGGINILSAQVLDNSSFLYGSFSSEYGNSIGGIFDMHLRTGNDKKRQYTAQASFIGFDFATEGPLSDGGEASYILNYRYSFPGLLAGVGIEVGGKSIGFQDLSFKVNKPIGQKGNIAFFGVGGLSFDRIGAKEFEEAKTIKDRSDRDYKGYMGAIGTTLDLRIGRGIFKVSAAYSGSGHELNQFTYSIPSRAFFSAGYENNSTDQVRSISSTNTSYRFSLWNSIVHIGSMYNYYFNRHYYNYGNDFSSVDYKTHLLNPYISVELPISQNILIETGLSGEIAFWDINNRLLPGQSGFIIELFNKSYEESTLDPRIKLIIASSDNSRLYLAAGRYSQLLDHSNYFFVYERTAGKFVEINRRYKLQRSYRYILGVSGRNSIRRISFELFFNHFPEIFRSSSGGYNYMQISTVNSLELSSARSYGISMMGSRSFSGNWFSNIAGSIFNSTWSNDRSNRFNSRFNFNFSGGKEWKYQRKGSGESVNVSINGIFQEGLKEPGFDLFVTTNNSMYYRVDIRLQLLRYKSARTASLTLDLQNITFRKNDAFQFADPFQRGIFKEKQRGLTPVLGYKIEF